ncbi:DNA polymerase [Aliiroseovarius halocynthiae]|uniref:Type-4 uracil-DNA glycosylase n=1 Tax=Aliiroseovarius halocynthiae TaxID=985055 RepID=A0A545SZQ6_9RHOB|nr:uracil-DNA glycosylase [Aliiroseovarius halocynthiae]TQV70456.1 uracil-DNA glycosylase [Aliiroseovarius halocynthiae]SMR81823.1 DNA polymerase [Aliiroseovarius halocynthiae]
MESAQDWHSAKALLEWQIELGAVDAISDAPVDRYALAPSEPKPAPKAQTSAPVELPKRTAPTPPPVEPKIDYVALAKQAAAGAPDLDGLKAAMKAFDGCELKKGARNTVISDGNPAARVMIIGEAPGRDEDIEGRPFVGRAGQLLDKMFAAIGMGRDVPLSKDAVYITNVMPWRPPQNRDPSPEEMAMMVPFLERHVQLVAPELIVLMGNTPCQAVLGKRGITRLRGQWDSQWGKPIMPMFHPAYLLRNPVAKREAWADLLEIQAKLNEGA